MKKPRWTLSPISDRCFAKSNHEQQLPCQLRKMDFFVQKSGENSEKRKRVVSPTMVYFMHHCSQTLTINMNIENQYANRSKLECRSALLHEIMVVRGVDSLNGFIQ